MKAITIKYLFNSYLVDRFSDYQLKGSVLYQVTEGIILKGYSFDSSGFDKNAIYVQGFVHPLYVPFETISYTFGNRIFSNTLEKSNELEFSLGLKTKMLKFRSSTLDDVNSFSDFMKRYKGDIDLRQVYSHEILAYGYILNDNIFKATIALRLGKKYVSREAQNEPEKYWFKEALERLIKVELLLRQDKMLAVEQILKYRDYSLSQLKLDPVR